MGRQNIVLILFAFIILIICLIVSRIILKNDELNTQTDDISQELDEIVFVYNSEYQQYEAEVNGIMLVTNELYDGYEESAKELAAAYFKKLPDIAQFMLDEEIRDFYGVQTVEELISHLGKPQINISWYVVTYLEHTLDDVHIIDVEFVGNFDEFLSVSIDG